jgi:uncharacterized protein YyaL (SSP411 family)
MSGLSDDQFGGFPVNGYQRLWPNLWRLQLLGGRSEEFSQSIEPLLHSPTYDVLDGGFFTCSLSLDWLSVDYDKFALENAGMLQTLALSTALSKNPSHRWFAERTFDFLADEMYQNGTVAGGRIGDESLYGRSLRSSFSPKELRERVEDSDTREAIRNAFDLRVEDNPQMTPRLIDEQMPISRASEFEKLLNPLRRNRPEPKFTGLSELDVAGFCVARLIESARMLGDRERLDRSREFFLNLDAFRTGDVVVHSIGGGNSSYAYLGDYLAYADAALQYFLSTGNAEAFEHGLRVLRRGLFLFKGQVSGEYDLVQRNDDAVGLQDIDAPEICDGLRESATSQVIRLTNSYGRLLGKNGTDLVKVSGDSIARFSPFVAGLGPYAASFYCAFREFASLQYAIVVGPTSFQDSLRLATLAPGHIISPVSGPVKAPGGRPGVYLISETSSSGPYSVEQAARQLKLPPF